MLHILHGRAIISQRKISILYRSKSCSCRFSGKSGRLELVISKSQKIWGGPGSWWFWYTFFDEIMDVNEFDIINPGYRIIECQLDQLARPKSLPSTWLGGTCHTQLVSLMWRGHPSALTVFFVAVLTSTDRAACIVRVAAGSLRTSGTMTMDFVASGRFKLWFFSW